MAAFVAWGRIVLLGPDGVERGAWVVGGRGAPTLDDVDALARAQLAARRAGGVVRIDEMSDDLRALLELVGLSGEMVGQAEQPEQAGVEEGVELGDPPV